MIKINKARISDVKKIHKMVNYYAKHNEMLPRSLNELYENIRELFVAKDRNSVVGCCALHISWDNLAEIKTLAVEPKYRGEGIGQQLVQNCLDEALHLGLKKVFALTYRPKFFAKLGFKRISKNSLPQKIWRECIDCPKFPNCGEVAIEKIVDKKG